MTVGEANAKDAPVRRDSTLAGERDDRANAHSIAQPLDRSGMPSPPTASHAISVLVPDEHPVFVRYAVAVGSSG